MNELVNSPETSWSRTRKCTVLSALGSLVVTCMLALSQAAFAQQLPPPCFDSQEKIDVFIKGEDLAKVQVEQLWSQADKDCRRLPGLSASYIQQMGLLMSAAAEKDISLPLLCRLVGQLSGVSQGWIRLVDGCRSNRPK